MSYLIQNCILLSCTKLQVICSFNTDDILWKFNNQVILWFPKVLYLWFSSLIWPVSNGAWKSFSSFPDWSWKSKYHWYSQEDWNWFLWNCIFIYDELSCGETSFEEQLYTVDFKLNVRKSLLHELDSRTSILFAVWLSECTTYTINLLIANDTYACIIWFYVDKFSLLNCIYCNISFYLRL